MSTAKDFIEEFYSTKEIIEGFELNEQVIFDSRKQITIAKTIKNCKFKNGATFESILSLKIIHFDNCEFDITTNSNKLNNIAIFGNGEVRFTNCLFRCHTVISGGNSREINFNKCDFENNFSILNIPEFCSIRVLYTNFKEFNLSKSNFKKLDLFKVNVSKILLFTNVKISSIIIGTGVYNKIQFNKCFDFDLLEIKNTSYSRDNLLIGNLLIPDVNLKGNILLAGASIDNFNISPHNNEGGRFKLQNITFNKEVIIKDSDLSDVQFNEINFKNAKICLDNSYLSDTVFSNILWPKNKEVVYYSDTNHYSLSEPLSNPDNKDNKEKTLIKKEIYRQLKNSSKAESNNIDALDFYRNEMDSYWNYIKGNSEIHFWDRVLIRIARVTSNFGISYMRPLLCLLGLHIVVFLFVLFFEDYNGCQIDFSNSSWEYFWKSFNSYFELIVPVRKFSEDLPASADVMMRIYSGFFIYHIIRGTRKFAKI